LAVTVRKIDVDNGSAEVACTPCGDEKLPAAEVTAPEIKLNVMKPVPTKATASLKDLPEPLSAIRRYDRPKTKKHMLIGIHHGPRTVFL
jgi:hypothetical protein